MKKFKKLAALLLALCMTVGFGVACGGGTESSSGAESSTATEATLTIEVVTETGEKVEGILFEIKKSTAKRPQELTTDADGKATYTGELADYVLTNLGGIPAYYGNDEWVGSIQNLTLSENTTLTLILYDTSPNGSKERPFHFVIDVESETNTIETTIPANTTYHFDHYKSTGQSMLIRSEHVEVTYKEITYKPVNGVLSVPLNARDTNEVVYFTLTNTSDSELTLSMELLSNAVVGSIERPFDLTLGDTTAAVKGTDAVYYRWTATAAGTLTVDCKDATATLVLENNTQSVVSNDLTVSVKENDVVYIVLSVKDADENTDASIAFTATFA